MSRTSSKSHYNYYHKEIRHAKMVQDVNFAGAIYCQFLGADWFVWIEFMRPY